MRFTLRRSGRLMTTIRTEHRLGGAELTALLCRFADVWGPYGPQLWETPPTPGRDLTHAQFDDLVRRALTAAGTGAYLSEDDWSIDYNAAQAATMAAWSAGQISRLYPGLAADVAQWALKYPPPAAEADDDEEE
jgi:hypothetical protein